MDYSLEFGEQVVEWFFSGDFGGKRGWMMKFDLIEIANIPYRNHKAEIYSAKVEQ